MNTVSLDLQRHAKKPKPAEGDLFKRIELYGNMFEIRYGYYEEIDRIHDPIEIYPDFIKNPVYTDDGFPFVTLMQEPCQSFQPKNSDPERDCGNCKYMKRGDELIAVCRCPRNQRTSDISYA